MRHSRRAFLFLAESLLNFTDLSPLKVPDLHRKFLERSADYGQYIEKMSVAVALNNLRGNSCRFQLEFPANISLDSRIDMNHLANRGVWRRGRNVYFLVESKY